MPVLPSYRNQSIDLHSKLTGFYIRATLALNGLNLRICRQSFLFFTLLRVWMSRSAISPLILRNSSITLFSSTYYSTDVGIPTTSFSLLLLHFQKLLTIIAKKTASLMFDRVLNTAWKVSVCGVFLVHIFPHSGWIRENTDQENSEYGNFYYYYYSNFFL